MRNADVSGVQTSEAPGVWRAQPFALEDSLTLNLHACTIRAQISDLYEILVRARSCFLGLHTELLCPIETARELCSTACFQNSCFTKCLR